MASQEKISLADEPAPRDLADKTTSAEQELDALSYSIAHDLRAPLRVVDGFVRILEEDYAPRMEPEAQRYLKLVRGGAQRMNQMIDGALEFSRLNRQILKPAVVDSASLVQAAYAEFAAERAGRTIELVVGLLPKCQGDLDLLRQVFRELLSNAIKFTKLTPAARIEIGSRETEGQQVYFVRDNGVGFDMRYSGKLFMMFQRLHSAEQFAGVGIGLAIVGRIVHRHGGRVWAEAAVDRGAEFSFTIPISASTETLGITTTASTENLSAEEHLGR